jgi:hypothetical protein
MSKQIVDKMDKPYLGVDIVRNPCVNLPEVWKFQKVAVSKKASRKIKGTTTEWPALYHEPSGRARMMTNKIRTIR